MDGWVLTLLLPIVQRVLVAISPEIRKQLENFAKDLWGKAQATPNPWDNVLVGILYAVLGLETPRN